ncbi:uncharacterized protein LOC113391231 [Ctenocephalides felis]|uniref:uncharacterized protein LOC113391231 n=1 Tax=Ctenocephalides felis TaxID=7515 RepID=UPI000E6E3C85|nr:uncharacterized protein LOC113391231 [Ctenocephalides felis]
MHFTVQTVAVISLNKEIVIQNEITLLHSGSLDVILEISVKLIGSIKIVVDLSADAGVPVVLDTPDSVTSDVPAEHISIRRSDIRTPKSNFLRFVGLRHCRRLSPEVKKCHDIIMMMKRSAKRLMKNNEIARAELKEACSKDSMQYLKNVNSLTATLIKCKMRNPVENITLMKSPWNSII